ncbi:MAG: DUF1028 domain-containing protein [Chloroflexota bacterium]
MTFSIVARDSETGDFGVAVASKFLAAGSVVSHARAGVGAIATQALANFTYGPDGLTLLAEGLSAAEAIERLTAADDGRDHRQLGIVDANGRAATYTGKSCIDWAGGRTAEGVAVQGNILVGPLVADTMLDAYLAPGLGFPERLAAALKAADDQGGDRRGRQSAAVVVKREKGGYGGNNDNWIDLRVDDDPAPVDKLMGLLELVHLYRDRPRPEDLLAIDETLAAELRRRLTDAGYAPDRLNRERSLADVLAGDDVERTGEPRAVPDGWDAGWEAALAEWISTENLEERMTARGWIDPRVLDHLRRDEANLSG